MLKNKLNHKLYNGQSAFATFIAINSPDIVEICGLLGFDFVVLDGEHGYISPETSIPMIRAAEACGMTPVVRVCENSESLILRTLDVGAHGIHVPQINSKEAAENAVKYAKYHPYGKRGVSFHRACGYGIFDINEYMERENSETLVIFHCENISALEHIDEIAATEGLDVLIFGPFDMSQSMGIPGKTDDPMVEAAAQKMLDACKRHGKIAGIFTSNAEDAEKRIKQGFRYMPVGVDCKIIADTYGKLIKSLNSIK